MEAHKNVGYVMQVFDAIYPPQNLCIVGAVDNPPPVACGQLRPTAFSHHRAPRTHVETPRPLNVIHAGRGIADGKGKFGAAVRGQEQGFNQFFPVIPQGAEKMRQFAINIVVGHYRAGRHIHNHIGRAPENVNEMVNVARHQRQNEIQLEKLPPQPLEGGVIPPLHGTTKATIDRVIASSSATLSQPPNSGACCRRSSPFKTL